ncbi:MAG: methionyl-tRNA formyltransferase [Bacteroidota bacterium]
MSEKASVIFMGTPEFAVPTLVKLNEEFGVKAVVTVPDKPQGRGKKQLPSPVKQKAAELSIPILQPDSLKDIDFVDKIKELTPDIIVVVAFRILPREVFSLAKLGTFNIHASLLPRYRGAAPINRAIIEGEKYTGLTSFLLDDKVDTGNILLQKKIEIPEGSTAGDLHDLMMPLSADMAVETCKMLLSGNFRTTMQDDSLACPAPKLFAENCRIDWNLPAERIVNFIHGTSPTPGAWTIWNGKRLKILRAELYKGSALSEPGSFSIEDDKFIIQCETGSINATEIQPQDKKSMKTADFVRGYRGETNGIL